MRSSSRRSPSARLLLALLIAGTACSDSRSGLPLDTAPPTFELTPQQDSGFAAALEDVRVRLLPALQTQDRSGRLGAALEDFSLALSSHDASRLRRALGGVEAALTALPGSEEQAAALAVELDAVRLLLAAARQISDRVPR